MPTLTRLAALVLFGIMALYLGSQYQSLQDEIPESQGANLFFAATAAAVGWLFVGRRIDHSFIRGFTVVVQGYVATLLLLLVLSATYDIFAKGYRMRYRTFGDALDGSLIHATSVLQQMMVANYLILVLGGAVVINILLVLVYRFTEAKRLAG